jgi:hypothetical protein
MRCLVKTLLLLFMVIIVSCNGNNAVTRKKKLIPEEEMVSVMTDLYLADGLLSFPPIRNLFQAKDSISNYIDIVNKHGYSKEQMDMTLKYYFIEDPKKLQKVYDQVLAKLSAMQSSLDTVAPEPAGNNLWNQKERLGVPEEGAHSSLYFSIPVKDTGFYEISFSAIIFNDDRSNYPRTAPFFWRSTDTPEGERNMWDKIELIRDGTRHSYSVRRKLTDTTYTHICGWLFQADDQPGNWVKHGLFTSISVTRITHSVE